MSNLLFWIGYIAFVVLLSRGRAGDLLGNMLDAPDPPPYYHPKSPARAAIQAKHAPEHTTTTTQEADK